MGSKLTLFRKAVNEVESEEVNQSSDANQGQSSEPTPSPQCESSAEVATKIDEHKCGCDDCKCETCKCSAQEKTPPAESQQLPQSRIEPSTDSPAQQTTEPSTDTPAQQTTEPSTETPAQHTTESSKDDTILVAPIENASQAEVKGEDIESPSVELIAEETDDKAEEGLTQQTNEPKKCMCDPCECSPSCQCGPHEKTSSEESSLSKTTENQDLNEERKDGQCQASHESDADSKPESEQHNQVVPQIEEKHETEGLSEGETGGETKAEDKEEKKCLCNPCQCADPCQCGQCGQQTPENVGTEATTQVVPESAEIVDIVESPQELNQELQTTEHQ